MKKIFGILIVSLALFVSCTNDLLEPFTPGSLTEEIAVTKSSDLVNLVNSSMNLMTNRAEYVFSSIFTDEAAPGFNNGGQGITEDYVFLMNVDNESARLIWQSQYFGLARVNRVLTFADKVVATSPADQQLINRSKAEALVLRALAHIKILSYFSPNPKDDAALAGVLADRIILTTDKPERTTNAKFYALIHADLDAAIAIFNVNTATAYANKTYYPSKVLAQALKARAFALKGDYPNAEIFASTVINTSGITLANTQNQYNNVFHTHNETANTEVIFRFRRTVQQNVQTTNLNNGWVSVANRRNGSPFYEVSRALYNKLTAVPNDFRLNTIVHLTGTSPSLIDPNYATATDVRNSDIIVLQKHGGQSAVTAANGFNPDFMVSRLSEMYFIRAEARVAAGDLVGVGTNLKAILDARFPTAQAAPVFANPQAAWKGILDERRKELSFEGFRFIDLKRIGTLAGAGLDRDAAEYASSAWNFPAGNPSNLPLSSFKFALPIPQAEVNGNSDIQQNDGY
ncbi:RagB/SusD family nutrient uptake outer membrane protein [Flavobacterium sp. RSP46]|uniref:RagB/SusD family nutrient uptake outer membrane protein n=1 Tax=Flavobacterium sp. RSP46 TaxID=2497486 RepID=UPI000F8980FB|nr:RagB/SusD family nutrient uptake outer membrane protein [Flavobacterium sp. RSP46]RTY90348.1 RagB/SusD family nutrient uptake outer membrane protein [Flavobacterium sp. RSP46]